MLHVRILGLASLFALLCLLLPGAALASTKCQCNNGSIAISMDDGDDACDDACDGMGGGRQWQPSDSDEDDDSDASNGETRREERRESGPR
jgi:hypothetical protein